MGLNIKLKQLTVADYVISDKVGIERKAAKDFNDSIIDGRLFQPSAPGQISQLARLSQRHVLGQLH